MQRIETSIGPLAAFENEGEGPLCVLLHGLQASKELFSRCLREPCLRNRAYIAPDLPGFGESAKPRDFDYHAESYAKLIEEIVASLGHKEIILIGHSLGGVIGTLLLKSQSLTIKAFVSLEGNLTPADGTMSNKLANISETEFTSQFLPDFIDELQSSNVPSVPLRLAALKRTSPSALYRTGLGMVTEVESGRPLKNFTEADCPRLLFVGEKSHFVTRQPSGGVQVKIVPGASHFLLSDNYLFVAEELCSFLNKLP